MKKMFLKSSLFFLILSFLFSPFIARAEINDDYLSFKAEVVEVLQEETKQREDGTSFKQQNLRLKALTGERQGEEFIYNGISKIEVANVNNYQEKDRVFVDVFQDEKGQESVYVTEYVRSKAIYWLIALFIITILIIGRLKGLRALLSLILTFVVIIKFILPQILMGRDPFLISLLGGLIIMTLIIYITEGWRKKSHLAILAVLLSLFFTLILAIIFSNLSRLTGLSQEEAVFLIGLGEATINFKGLLLAGILIGAIGVLDDVIIGQIETVERIKEANNKLSPQRIFSLAYKIGNTHLSTMVNTLFLTYAGAALPLLLIFTLGQEIGLSTTRALNSEIITTEIVRTLVGGIGIMASMPIATFLGAYGLKRWTKKEK